MAPQNPVIDIPVLQAQALLPLEKGLIQLCLGHFRAKETGWKTTGGPVIPPRAHKALCVRKER